jgi:hypothetical protein
VTGTTLAMEALEFVVAGECLLPFPVAVTNGVEALAWLYTPGNKCGRLRIAGVFGPPITVKYTHMSETRSEQSI